MKSIACVVLALSLGGWIASAAEGEAKPRPAAPIPEWAKKYDKNGDGVLDKEERAAAVKARREEMMLKKFDKNGDGKLDAEETKAMNEQLRKEREAARPAAPAPAQEKKEEKKDDKK